MKKGLAYPLFSFRNRVLIIVLGLVIGISSLLFTNDMARQLREKEQNEVAIWSAAFRDLGVNPSSPLLSALINSKSNIPFIIVDGQMNIASSHLIPDHILNHPNLRRKKIEEMAAANSFIQVTTMNNETFYIFYDESRLLKTLVYFPYIQLMIIVVFVTFGYITFRSSKQDEQNRVWIGLAKETAHQLGTPTSSLLGWIEYLRIDDAQHILGLRLNVWTSIIVGVVALIAFVVLGRRTPGRDDSVWLPGHEPLESIDGAKAPHEGADEADDDAHPALSGDDSPQEESDSEGSDEETPTSESPERTTDR